MKKMAGVVLALIAASSHAEESKSLLYQASDEWVYQMFKNQNTPMGKAVRNNRRDAENREIRSAPQIKSARMRKTRQCDRRRRPPLHEGTVAPENFWLHSQWLCMIRHLGKVEQPQNCCPALGPDFTERITSGLPHLGH